jgi:hypothetical protein
MDSSILPNLDFEFLPTLPLLMSNDDSNSSILHRPLHNSSHLVRPHPHAGARNEFGEWGYVPDASTEHLKQSTSLNIKYRKACNLSAKNVEGVGGHQVLEKIQPLPQQQSTRARILCLVYTHSGNLDSLQAIIDTWAKYCDGFLAASNQTIPSLGSIDLPHMGPETYGNMWQKIRSMWAYAHDHYIDEFDYFHM